jgi:hypothetical protein
MLSLNVTGGRLVDRIRRLLTEPGLGKRRPPAWTMAAVLVVAVSAIVLTPALTIADASTPAEEQPDVALQFAQVPDVPLPAEPRLVVPSLIAPGASKTPNLEWDDSVRETRAALEMLARETQGIAVVPEPPAPPQLPTAPPPPAARPLLPPFAPAPPVPPLPTGPETSVAPPAPPAVQALPVAPAPAAIPAPPAVPASPAVPAPPAPPMFFLGQNAIDGDTSSELARQLTEASQQLLGGFDDLRKAAQDVARQQVQLQMALAEVTRLRNAALGTKAQIEAVRKALEEMNAKATLLKDLQPNVAEMQKQIEAIQKSLERMRAR